MKDGTAGSRFRPPREIANEVKIHGSVFVYREETHSQELRQARKRAAGAVPAGNPACVVSSISAGNDSVRVAKERGSAGGVHLDFSDFEPFGQRPPRVRGLFA